MSKRINIDREQNIDWERLFRTDTFWMERIQNNLYSCVMTYMKETKKTKLDLAIELGKSERYVTQILDGKFDGKLSDLVKLCLVIGKAPLYILDVSLDTHIQSLLLKTQ